LFYDLILGNRYGPGVFSRASQGGKKKKNRRTSSTCLPQTTWGGWILTYHLNYVAGYTGPVLFLFERTHNYPVDNHGFVPWRLRCLGESNICSASLVRWLSAQFGWASFCSGSETAYRPMVMISWRYFHKSFFTSPRDILKILGLPVTPGPDFFGQKWT